MMSIKRTGNEGPPTGSRQPKTLDELVAQFGHIYEAQGGRVRAGRENNRLILELARGLLTPEELARFIPLSEQYAVDVVVGLGSTLSPDDQKFFDGMLEKIRKHQQEKRNQK